MKTLFSCHHSPLIAAITRYKILILCVFYLMCYLFLLDNKPEIDFDSSGYILLAKSIASGNGYKSIWLEGNPVHAHYPPVLPLIMAPVIYFFGYNFLLMRLVIICLAICSLFIIYQLIRIHGPQRKLLPIAVALLTGVSTWVLSCNYQIVTEIPYIFFSTLSLYLICKSRSEKNNSIFYIAMIALFTTCSILTRTIGVSLLVALIAYVLFEKEKRIIWKSEFLYLSIIAILASILISPWVINVVKNGVNNSAYWQGFASHSNPYDLNGNGTLVEAIAHNIYGLIFYALPNVTLGMKLANRNVYLLIIPIIIVAGFIKTIIKKRSILEYYLFFYLLILSIYSYTRIEGTRFLIPVIPFVFYYLIIGIEIIAGYLEKKYRIKKTIVIILSISIILLSNMQNTVSYSIEAIKGHSAEKNSFLEMTNWIKYNTPRESILGIPNTINALYYLYSERKAKTLGSFNEANKAIEDNKFYLSVKNSNIDYIIIDYTTQKLYDIEQIIIMLGNAHRTTMIYQNSSFKVFQVITPSD